MCSRLASGGCYRLSVFQLYPERFLEFFKKERLIVALVVRGSGGLFDVGKNSSPNIRAKRTPMNI